MGRLQNNDYRVISYLIQQSDRIHLFDKACSRLEQDRVSREYSTTHTPMNTALLTTTTPSKSPPRSTSPVNHRPTSGQNNNRQFNNGKDSFRRKRVGGRGGRSSGRGRGYQSNYRGPPSWFLDFLNNLPPPNGLRGLLLKWAPLSLSITTKSTTGQPYYYYYFLCITRDFSS